MIERTPDADFVAAFKQALADYGGWTAGGREPCVTFSTFHGPQGSQGISAIADWATVFGDCPLPQVIYDYLFDLMDDTRENQERKARLSAKKVMGNRRPSVRGVDCCSK